VALLEGQTINPDIQPSIYGTLPHIAENPVLDPDKAKEAKALLTAP
jgi:hypothetical protein